MKRASGREVRKLILAVTLMTLALVIGVIAYFMVDVILTANYNIKKNKEMVLDKTVMTVRDMGKHTGSIGSNPKFLGMLNKDLLQRILQGEAKSLYELIMQFASSARLLEYAGVVVDGDVATYITPTGKDIDPSGLPAVPDEGDYVVMDSLGGEKGYFVSVFYPVNLSGYGFGQFYLNSIVDRTQEMQEVEDYFVGQRSDFILRMSIAAGIAIIITLLITTFGLRYFTGKYVTEPIDELNRMAEEIADGSFEGGVEVDPGSAYAALQGLLRSGHLILHRMDEEA